MASRHDTLIKLLLIVSAITNLIFVYNFDNGSKLTNLLNILGNKEEKQLSRLDLREKFFNSSKFLTRDHVYYKCKDRRQIGGETKPINKLERVDGSWYICFDKNLAPITNSCRVLSFGINTDESFDYEINRDYGCEVHSFDPFIESKRFTEIRSFDPKLADAYRIPVNQKWTFYRIGVTGSAKNVINKNKIGWIDTLENIIEMTGFKDKVIDVFKMDIESGEINVLEEFNIDYACKYYKQFVLETHAASLTQNLHDLMLKLDKCFSLFHRDSRLIGPNYSGEVVLDVAKTGFNINLQHFVNEINLANFLISTGELYFINENFRIE